MNRNAKIRNRAITCMAAAALATWAHGAGADDKTVSVEPVPAYPTFTQWVSSVVVALPPTAPEANTIRTIAFAPSGAVQAAHFEPAPVILGVPELPLAGDDLAQAARNWGSRLNYQGMHMSLVVLDARGARRELRPASSPIQPGEAFKIRITATFPAVASVDQVQGDIWYGRRSGQVYPAAGMSVQMNAGETVELPLNPAEYFVMDRNPDERLLLSVRHAKALGEARSTQPVYRQDGSGGSSYLQLVPRGDYPAIEQIVSATR